MKKSEEKKDRKTDVVEPLRGLEWAREYGKRGE